MSDYDTERLPEGAMSGGLDAAREFVPGRARRAVYALASVLGYALLAAVAGFAAAGMDVPTPLVVALSVLGALIGPLGQLAASNTAVPPRPTIEGSPQHG